jgi:hypothetical protein
MHAGPNGCGGLQFYANRKELKFFFKSDSRDFGILRKLSFLEVLEISGVALLHFRDGRKEKEDA